MMQLIKNLHAEDEAVIIGLPHSEKDATYGNLIIHLLEEID